MNKFCHDIKIIVIVVFLMVSSVAITLWIVREVKDFSPPRVPVPAALAGPGHTNCLPSIMDIQRELNRHGYKLKVDGVYGALTRAAHEKAIGDQYAKELMRMEKVK